MGRTSTARERLLDAASELIHRRGYSSIGVAELCAAADVRKGSFYHFFDSKQSLTIEVVDTQWACYREDWVATIKGDGTAIERIEALFQAQVDGQRVAKEASGMLNGCLFGNLAIELSTQDELVSKHLQVVFDDQVELLAGLLDEAAAEGSIPASSTGSAKARGLLAQLEGQIMFAKLANDLTVLDNLWPSLAALLDAR